VAGDVGVLLLPLANSVSSAARNTGTDLVDLRLIEFVVDQWTVQVLQLLGGSRRQPDKAERYDGRDREFPFHPLRKPPRSSRRRDLGYFVLRTNVLRGIGEMSAQRADIKLEPAGEP
jgi:hypothetical protein